MNPFNIATDGLLAGGISISIASRGLLTIEIRQKRPMGGSDPRSPFRDIKKEFPEGEYDNYVVEHRYDEEEDEDIILIMMSIL